MGLLQQIFSALRLIPRIAEQNRELGQEIQRVRHTLGRVENRQLAALPQDGPLSSYEFCSSSQWGEDGIIQHLLRHVRIDHRIFVEFGVESYVEANTRFLLVNDNWSGLVLDGGAENITAIRRDPIYWQRNLKAVQAFITRENINELLQSQGVSGEIGLLSVDIDGVDYWVWEAITCVNPSIVIAEYNALFGPDRAVTVPYDAAFQRAKAHHSQSYYGASLAALVALGKRKGYAFVGSNSAGNNAFFVRRDLLREPLCELTAAEGWVKRSFREARDAQGKLTFPNFEEEAALVNGLPLVEVEQ